MQKILFSTSRQCSLFSSQCFARGKVFYVQPLSSCNVGVRQQKTYSQDHGAAPPLPSQARVVVCGGGVIGTSVAYHLALQGWTDVVVVEQGRTLACGTTWHSAALIGQIKGCSTTSILCKYSRDLYHRLEEEGQFTGFKQCGSVAMARSEDMMMALKRKQAMVKPLGIESHLLTPQEIKSKCDLVRTDDLEGGLWIPEDGTADPNSIATTLARLAKEKGVKVNTQTKVTKILTENGRVREVQTNKGNITCEYFVNCSGFWGYELGMLSDPPVQIPLHPCNHYLMILQPPKDTPVDAMMPVFRDYEGRVYFREQSGNILAGCFEKNAKAVFDRGIEPEFENKLLPVGDISDIACLFDVMEHRVPALKDSKIVNNDIWNGPESFSPDGRPILGEAPEIQNYYVATAMSSAGIVSAGGVGLAMAEWITQGRPSTFGDLIKMDIRRFGDIHGNQKFLQDRAEEVLGTTFSIPYPQKEYSQCRGIRRSPVYPNLIHSGAVFGETVGWERSLYFDQDGDCPEDPLQPPGSFKKPDWFDNVHKEYAHCKRTVGLIDQTYFAKFEIESEGTQVVDYLQYLCANNIDVKVGQVIHTGLLNEYGGFENDCTLVRLAENKYFMISLATLQTRGMAWLKRHLPSDRSVRISDVTSSYTTLNLIGPMAKELLHELTKLSMKPVDFPAMTCQTIDFGYARGIHAMRLTHSKEDGWMLYIPSEYAPNIYVDLMTRGRIHNICNVGLYAHRALRIEGFLAFWGLDLTDRTTPLECGRESRVVYDMKDFIGKQALLKQKREGVKRLFVQLIVDSKKWDKDGNPLDDNKHDKDCDPWTWGGEPIYRNGKYVGTVTSSCYGYTLQSLVCLGFIQNLDKTNTPQVINGDWVKAGHYEIDIAGYLFPATVKVHTG